MSEIHADQPQVMRYFFNGYIDEKRAKKTIAALRAMHDADPNANWDITISSQGGHMVPSCAIYSELHSYSARDGGSHFVITRTRGQAASGASLIFQAGDWRVMGAMDTIMLHEPLLTCEYTPLDRVKSIFDECEEWLERYAKIYTSRSEMSAQEFRENLVGGDWRLYYEQAKVWGFVDGLG